MYRFDIVAVGTLFLIIYILYDFMRHGTQKLLRRVMIYSFIFYALNVLQLTTGGVNIPPENNNLDWNTYFQLTPFYFLLDLFVHYQVRGLDWFFWNSVKLSLYNLIMLFPLGVYLPVLFGIKSLRRVTLYATMISLTIEVYQVILSYTGLTFYRTFNVDDILLNTLGAVIGFLVYQLTVTRFRQAGVFFEFK